jgi:hypothetical protein
MKRIVQSSGDFRKSINNGCIPITHPPIVAAHFLAANLMAAVLLILIFSVLYIRTILWAANLVTITNKL